MPEGHSLADLRVDDQHRYFYRGRQEPGVTRILRQGGWAPDFGKGGPSPVLQAALDRGTKVHAYASSVDTGTPNPALITPQTADYIAADAKLRTLAGYEVIATELPLVHPILHYAGRLDVVAWRHVFRILGDRKTGVSYHASVWLQLVAYELMWNFWFPDQPIDATAVFLLKPNTDPRYIPNPCPELARQVWMAALWKHRWHSQMGWPAKEMFNAERLRPGIQGGAAAVLSESDRSDGGEAAAVSEHQCARADGE